MPILQGSTNALWQYTTFHASCYRYLLQTNQPRRAALVAGGGGGRDETSSGVGGVARGASAAATAASRTAAPAAAVGDAVAVAGFPLNAAAAATEGQVGAVPTFFGQPGPARVFLPVAEAAE